MGKNTWLAKAVRTFWITAAAGLVAIQGIDFVTDWKDGLPQVGLILAGSVVAAGLAALTALTPANPTDPTSKALAQFLQAFVGSMAGVVIVEATGNAFLTFGQQAGRAAIAAAVSAVVSFVTNKAEDSTVQPAPPPQPA